MNTVGIRGMSSLLIISAYLVLNVGFMLIRMPPGVNWGIPIGEILIIWYGFGLIFDSRWLLPFSRSIFLIPFLLWWGIGIGRALAAMPEYGVWALRDASHVIDSLFLWIGFLFARQIKAVDLFFSWLRWVLLISILYSFTFPFREDLKDFSPTVEAPAGYITTILFHYSSMYIMVLLTAAYLIIKAASPSRVGAASPSWVGIVIIAGLLVGYGVVIFQARTMYLQVICVFILFLWLHRPAFRKMGIAVVLASFAFLGVVITGVDIPGRVGENISFEFIINHFISIAGVESEGVIGPARGISLRLDWWSIIWRQVTDSAGNFVFGLGHGLPLVEFAGPQNQIVREPHNSYLSIFGRLGLFGIIVFTWGHIHLVRAWFQAYMLCRRVGYRLGRERLLIFMVYFVLVWVYAIGEDAFEKPYNAIPYYFFWGIVLHYGLHLKSLFLTLDNEPSELPNSKGDHAYARTSST